MDFFERWFGIAPDGGNGMLEAAYMVCLAAVISAAVYYGRRALTPPGRGRAVGPEAEQPSP